MKMGNLKCGGTTKTEWSLEKATTINMSRMNFACKNLKTNSCTKNENLEICSETSVTDQIQHCNGYIVYIRHLSEWRTCKY